MDGRLDRELRTRVYPDLMKHDKDNVFLIDGSEGTGKSKFGDIMGAHAALNMGCDYDIDSVCLAPEEFRNRIQDCPNRSVVIYDEAHRGMGSKRALSEINNILVDLMMEMRQKNLFVLIIMPTFFLLEKYAALFRSKGLFHVYEKNRKRGFWVFYNEKNKKKLYVLGKKLLDYNVMSYPSYRGKFYNQYCIDEAEYRAKKLKVFQQRPSLTKAEHFKEQRDILIRLIYEKFNTNKTKFTEIMRKTGINLKREMITDIINGKTIKNQGITRNSDGKFTENDGNGVEIEDFDGIGSFRTKDITSIEEEEAVLEGEEVDFDEKNDGIN